MVRCKRHKIRVIKFSKVGEIEPLMTSAMKGSIAYLNEKVFNGSIIPSIVLHGVGNFVDTMIVAFS